MDVEKEKSGQLTDKEEPMDTDSVKLEAEIDLAKTAPDNHASKGADKSGFPPAEVKQEPGSEEDDDPVIHEIPVFLSRSISKLYLFQYPVRPASMPYDEVDVSRARIKPVNKQIALNVDGATSGREERVRTFESNVMDKQVLVGSSAVEKTGRYAVGILNDNELHLTQLEGVLSLRPSLGYLDKSDMRSKTSTADSDAEAAADVKPEAVTVKFARGDPEKNKKYKEKSFEYQKKLQGEEAWFEADFNQMTGATWDAESQRMFCGADAMDKVVTSVVDSPDDYLLSLKDGQGS